MGFAASTTLTWGVCVPTGRIGDQDGEVRSASKRSSTRQGAALSIAIRSGPDRVKRLASNSRSRACLRTSMCTARRRAQERFLGQKATTHIEQVSATSLRR